MKRSLASVVLASLSVLLLVLPAAAEKGGKGKGQGHGNSGAAHGKSKGGGHGNSGNHGNAGQGKGGGNAKKFASSDRDIIRSYYRDSYVSNGNCPPGLAKKNNGCMPPGQAKRWSAGSTLPDDVVLSPLPSELRMRLAPPMSGYEYGYVGGDVILYAPATRVVVDVYFPF